MEKVLEITNLSKKFGKTLAVDNLSFEINEGEVVGLLGPNGAGKTTTINMLLGLIKPTAGEIKVFNLSFEPNRERILGQMNFSAAYVDLPWRLKVWENLYTFARLYGVSGYQKKVDQLLAEFQISEAKNKFMKDLSSGQIARIHLCKAFINSPKLLLLDEPTVFMDPDVADVTRKYILKKVKQDKTSVLFTSHNMGEVSEVCDRVIFLDQGKIIAQDTPLGLAQRIKFCRVRLLFMVPEGKVSLFLAEYQYKFRKEDKEFVIEVEENEIGQLLGRLSLARLKYAGITIEKPTLEDFFLSVARKKMEKMEKNE